MIIKINRSPLDSNAVLGKILKILKDLLEIIELFPRTGKSKPSRTDAFSEPITADPIQKNGIYKKILKQVFLCTQ